MKNAALQLQLRQEGYVYKINEHGVCLNGKRITAFKGKFLSYYIDIGNFGSKGWAYGYHIDIRIPGITIQGLSSPCSPHGNYGMTMLDAVLRSSIEMWEYCNKDRFAHAGYQKELENSRTYYIMADFLKGLLLLKPSEL